MKIAGVRFKENWKVYDFDASEVDVAIGDNVIVDSERGLGFARVVRLKQGAEPAGESGQTAPPAEKEPVRMEQGLEIETDEPAPEQKPAQAESGPRALRKIIRKASEEDRGKEEKNKEREAEAFTVCQELIAERELPMKLIRVDYSFDATRATFFFFSETRVDFRELVKELAYKLKSRIEMRQIGVRDVARLIGGYGPCGRELCCASFLRNFEPVSIRMAKKQEMVLNPAKISGVCGRLLCCLSYEYEFYDQIKKDVADLRDAAAKEKTDEIERRAAEERREAEERRQAEEKKRQEERRQKEEQQRERQRQGGKGGGKPDRRREQPQDKKQQAPAGQPQAKQQARQEARPPQQAPQQQKPQQGPGEKSEKKKNRRRFWRKKKKQQQGENKPQGPQNS